MASPSKQTKTNKPIPVPSFPDPNAQRNRVPGDAELGRLKELADSNAKIIYVFEEELDGLRKMYDSIHARYIEQQLELEATQSELHRVKSLISSTEQQRAVRLAEQTSLTALRHPIRRCPDEILKEIFEAVLLSVSKKTSIKQSVQLSNVCKRWRAIAISIPMLWISVKFNLTKLPVILLGLQEMVVPRLKGRGADITIESIDRTVTQTMKTCGLVKFPTIETLSLQLKTADEFPYLLPFQLQLRIPVRKLVVHSISSSSSPRIIMQGAEVEGMMLLDQFPGATVALFRGLSSINFQRFKPNHNLTDIDLVDVGQVNILSLLRSCPKLESLKVGRSPITIEDTVTPVVAPAIKHLDVRGASVASWMAHSTFTNMESLVLLPHGARTSTEAVSFISRHRSIKKLVTFAKHESVIEAAPQIVELHVPPPLQLLSQSQDGSQVALPHLQRLFVFISTGIEPSMEEFDALVRSRCLPLGHPKSLATTQSHILSTIALVPPLGNPALKLYQSQLYKESTRVNGRHQYYGDKIVAFLTWPQYA